MYAVAIIKKNYTHLAIITMLCTKYVTCHSWLAFNDATSTILAFQHQILGHNLVSFSPRTANEMQTSPTASIRLTMDIV